MADIEHWQMQDLKRHFEMGDSPTNATLVVAGAVAFDEFTRLARKHLEPIPAHAHPPPVTTREPEQLGERRVTVCKLAQLPMLMVAYHVPEARHADYFSLCILRNILFHGQSGRMYLRLVDRDQLAFSVSAEMAATFDPSLFTVTVQPREGVAPGRCEQALYEEFDRLAKTGPDARELEKAKNIELADFYREIKSINGKAHALGQAEVFFGDYRKLFTMADDYSKVTAEDVRQAAAKYFMAKNRTVATLVPETGATPQPDTNTP